MATDATVNRYVILLLDAGTRQWIGRARHGMGTTMRSEAREWRTKEGAARWLRAHPTRGASIECETYVSPDTIIS